MPTLDLPATNTDGTVNVVVETQRGSGVKLKYEEASGLFMLNRVLPAGLVFPFDFGFIPGTRGEDGDPLDVLLVTALSLPVGVLVRARLVGVIAARQREVDGRTLRNDRLLAVPALLPAAAAIRDLGDLEARLLDEVEAFFVSYNAQSGKNFQPERRGTAAEAMALVTAAGGRPAG